MKNSSEIIGTVWSGTHGPFPSLDGENEDRIFSSIHWNGFRMKWGHKCWPNGDSMGAQGWNGDLDILFIHQSGKPRDSPSSFVGKSTFQAVGFDSSICWWRVSHFFPTGKHKLLGTAVHHPVFSIQQKLLGGWFTPLKNMKVNWDD